MFHVQANQIRKSKKYSYVCVCYCVSTPVVQREKNCNVAIFLEGVSIAISESRHYDDLCKIYPILLEICMYVASHFE